MLILSDWFFSFDKKEIHKTKKSEIIYKEFTKRFISITIPSPTFVTTCPFELCNQYLFYRNENLYDQQKN